MVDVLFNPILLVSDPRALPLLMNEFCIYSWNGEAKSFVDLNTKIDKLLNKKLKQLPLPALGEDSTATITGAEIHDELGGLVQTQTFFEPAKDTKTVITDELSWLEPPEIFRRYLIAKQIENDWPLYEVNRVSALGGNGAAK